ncbi:MAG: LCP family protein [Caloramator sp.]|nr:LCP family protein [Caloramator sp.]
MKRFIKLILIILLIISLPIIIFRVNKPKEMNVLLVGVDAGDYEHKDAPKRSDTIMLIHLDTMDKKIYMYSIPRDTRVKANGEFRKINSIHAIGGIDLLKEKIEDMLKIKIDHYIKVDYKAFRELVDAIGGIDVLIPFDMNYDARDIKIHFKKGEKVHLDGQKAEQFVRWRKNNDGSGYALGDIGRISTQQEFLIKVAEKLKSPIVLFRFPKVLGVVTKNVSTDLSNIDMLKYAFTYIGINKNDIKTKVMSGEPKYIHSVSYYIPSYDNDIEFLKNFSSNIENNKKDYTIKILNSTNKNGLAAKYKEILKENKYEVAEIGNYNKKLKETIIYCNDEEVAEEIKDIIGCGIIKKDVDQEEDAIVILGLDSVK